jgi:hypothetical protein
MATLLSKIVTSKYTVVYDGKNCIYAASQDGGDFVYAELKYFENFKRTFLKVGQGLNLFRITNKQHRNFLKHIQRGASIYVKTWYQHINTKCEKSHRYVKNK